MTNDSGILMHTGNNYPTKKYEDHDYLLVLIASIAKYMPKKAVTYAFGLLNGCASVLNT